MAREVTAQDRRAELHQSAKDAGRKFVNLAFPEGVGEDMDFQAMEDMAGEAVRGVMQGFAREALWTQAQAFGSSRPCPGCGSDCEVDWSDRTLQSRYGDIVVPEPKCHCSRCKRDFFPSAAVVEAGRA